MASRPGPGAGTCGDARNVADLVRRAAARAGRRTAVIAGEQRPTWSELDSSVDALAAGLTGLGLVAGERVAIAAGSGLPFVLTWFGALRAGLVAVPLNPSHTARELAFQVADSGARLVITERDVDGAFGTAEHVVRVGTPAWAVLSAGATGSVASTTGGEDLAALVYTSGTSGRPRGAMLSHRALLANLDQVGAAEPPVAGSDDIVLIPVPLFHIYGLNTGLDLVAACGATAVLVGRFDPVATLELVGRERVTVIIGAPPMYVAWSMLPADPHAFAQVRVTTSGSAPLPPDVLERMARQNGRAVYEGYGMTETAPVLTMTPPAATPKPGSVGRPLPGVELRLAGTAPVHTESHYDSHYDSDSDVTSDSDTGADTGASAGTGDEPGEAGEVVVRGANLFSGYWPDGAGGPDADGWFATGDVGVLDADGDLHLVDRLGDVILVSGFNVYPREVEDVLRTHPAVADVVVLGAPHPYTGETVRALVVPAGPPPAPAELIAYAATLLARYKCPTVIELVDALPHTVTGKVSRAQLQERP
jgi:long-chain acyl-CoA synthetase